jgi:toxin ParE1/3/4
MLPVRFHPEAQREFVDGASFYGERFVQLLEKALALILEMPRTWPTWPGRPHVHRHVVPKLPYAIIYSIAQDSIFVIAVEHTRRRPGYWLTRL